MSQTDPLTDGTSRGESVTMRVPWQTLVFAAAWFFCILFSYSSVRPLRETMNAMGGIAVLQGVMLVTFITMLLAVPAYAWLVNVLPRRWVVRVVFHFFAISLFGFAAAFTVDSATGQKWAARVFVVWVNVFGLFATSVFWSVLTDLFNDGQAKRFFGWVATGGTAGAIAGSFLTSVNADWLSTAQLMLVPAIVLEIGLMFAWRLERRVQRESDAGNRPMVSSHTGSGGILVGITRVLQSPYLAMICLFLCLIQACGTLLYFQQTEIVGQTIAEKNDQVRLFARIDLAVQLLTLFGQLVLSRLLLRRCGVAFTLALLPLVYGIGFVALSTSTTLSVLIAAVIATRGIGYGITVPAREVLFTVVDREDKYKSKNFIDTVVMRGSDAASGQLIGSLRNLFGVAGVAINGLGAVVSVIWIMVAWRLGRQQRRLALADA